MAAACARSLAGHPSCEGAEGLARQTNVHEHNCLLQAIRKELLHLCRLDSNSNYAALDYHEPTCRSMLSVRALIQLAKP